MNKICGYNCEHNKGGQCQITYCDKIGEITTTTQWLSGGRQQGKTYQLIKDQQKEIERLKSNYEKIYNENCKLREQHNITDISLLDENNRLNNIINELEKTLNEEVKGRLNGKDNKFINEGVQLYKEYIKETLKELKEGK